MVGEVAVERIWPLGSPNIEEVKVKGKVKKNPKRAKLYFLRNIS